MSNRRNVQPRTKAKYIQWFEMHCKGMPMQAIASTLNIHVTTVEYAFRQLRYEYQVCSTIHLLYVLTSLKIINPL